MDELKLSREFWIDSVCLAFLTGVSLMSWRVGFSLFGVLVPMAMMFWCWENRGSLVVRWWVMMVLVVLVGMLRMEWTVEDWKAVADVSGVTEISGVVAGFPDVRADRQNLLIRAKDGLVQLQISSMKNVWPADWLTVSGTLLSARDLSWQEVEIENFFRLGVQAVVKKPGLVEVGGVAESDYWLQVLRGIYWVRVELVGILGAALTEPSASLEAGILLGDRGNLSAEINGDFQKTGLTHILAISGFNITLVINLILLFSMGMGKKKTLLVSLVLIGVFILLTGAGASVLRAGVMGLMALTVKTLGRPIKPLKLILLSTALIVLFSPAILDFDLSFQLSLVATMSLIFFADRFQMKGLGGAGNYNRRTSRISGWREWVMEGVGLTLAAQVLTLPLMFFSFGRISLISPLANLLVGPFIPLLMLLGTVLIGVQMVFPWATVLLAGVVEILVSLMVWIIHSLANWPLAQVELGKGEVWWAVGYYLVVFGVWRKLRAKSAK